MYCSWLYIIIIILPFQIPFHSTGLFVNNIAFMSSS